MKRVGIIVAVILVSVIVIVSLMMVGKEAPSITSKINVAVYLKEAKQYLEDGDFLNARQLYKQAMDNTEDFQRLKEASKREKWTDLTGVAPDFFGPMWPNGLPRNWPAAPVTPSAPVARRPRRKPKVDELGLPARAIAF